VGEHVVGFEKQHELDLNSLFEDVASEFAPVCMVLEQARI
jgi:hypothetical protein